MLPNTTWILMEIILLILLCYCALCIFKHLWDRKFLYISSMKVPGPFTLPYIGKFFLCSDPLEIVSEMSKVIDSYKGEIFNLWLSSKLYFVLSDPEHIQTVTTNAGCVNKGEFSDMMGTALGDGLLTASGQKWKRHKKILLPIFFKKNIESFMEIFTKKIDTLVLNLEQYSKTGEVVPARLLYYSILQMVSVTVVGVDIDARSMNSGLGECMRKLLEIQILRMFTTIYNCKWLFNFTTKKREGEMYLKNIKENFDKLINKMRRESSNSDDITEKGPKRISLQNFLPRNEANGNDLFTKTEFRDEVITLLISGTDTTAVTVGMTLVALGLYPEIQKKVYDEVMTVVGPVNDIEADNVSNLKYTEMVMKESLRYFNPIVIVFKKAETDIALGSTFIPRGSDLIISLKSVHFNPKIWPNPFKYDPERFSTEKIKNSYTFIPFSTGLRPCVGEKLAYLLVKTVIVGIIRKYEVFTDYKSLQEVEYRNDFVISPKKGYKLRIRKRENIEV